MLVCGIAYCEQPSSLLCCAALQATWIGLQLRLKPVGDFAGLVAGVFLLGYGLVEIPRGMWNEANPEDRLRSACYR